MLNMRGDGIYCALSHEKIPARRECVPYRYLVVASQLVPTEQPGCNRGGFSALCKPPCISPVILFGEEKKGVFPWLSVESFPSCGLVPLINPILLILPCLSCSEWFYCLRPLLQELERAHKMTEPTHR